MRILGTVNRPQPSASVSPRPSFFRGLLRLLRQGLGFTAVGAAQLLLDWAVLVGLSAMGVNLPLANVLGRAAGAGLGFWGNGRLTFAGGRLPRRHQALRFILLWLLLTTLSTLAVTAVAAARGPGRAWLLKPLIEAVLALFSFLASRHWVFR